MAAPGDLMFIAKKADGKYILRVSSSRGDYTDLSRGMDEREAVEKMLRSIHEAIAYAEEERLTHVIINLEG